MIRVLGVLWLGWGCAAGLLARHFHMYLFKICVTCIISHHQLPPVHHEAGRSTSTGSYFLPPVPVKPLLQQCSPQRWWSSGSRGEVLAQAQPVYVQNPCCCRFLMDMDSMLTCGLGFRGLDGNSVARAHTLPEHPHER